MPTRPKICPICKTRLDKISFGTSGAKYGCGKCGGWFSSDELSPVSANDGVMGGFQAPPRSSHDLTRMSVVLKLAAKTIAESVDELVPKALHGTGEPFLRSYGIAQQLRESLKFQGVEFHRGLAFVHSRVDALPVARTALGISPDGLDPGSASRGKVFVVVLFLRSPVEPGFTVPLWARRKLCNDLTIQKLRKTSDMEAVFRVLDTA